MSMQEVQQAFREADPGLYSKETDRADITPDRVGPAIEGYFHLPAIWIGEEPNPETVKKLNPAVHHQVVYAADLEQGIRIRVQRDGTFLFDFANWPLAPITLIPGYTVADPKSSWRATKEHQAAENLAEDRAALRAQLMNVHQACLATAQFRLKRSSSPLGLPVRPSGSHKAITLDTPLSYYHYADDPRALARNFINNSYNLEHDNKSHRRIIDISVVARSIEILESIVDFQDEKVIHICDTAYIFAQRQMDRRYGESVVAGWTACEQLISIAWTKHLESLPSTRPDTVRVNRDRMKKLKGRDYSASVMVEALEIAGVISGATYDHLEFARKARNAWAHAVKTPSETDLYHCRRGLENLMSQVLGVDWHVHGGAGGGVPQWPVWMWEVYKGR